MVQLIAKYRVMAGRIVLVVLIPAGYFFVYVMTPLDLGCHLSEPPFLQLWPSVIFFFFMVAGSPEKVSSAANISGAVSKRAATRPVKGHKPKRVWEPK